METKREKAFAEIIHALEETIRASGETEKVALRQAFENYLTTAQGLCAAELEDLAGALEAIVFAKV